MVRQGEKGQSKKERRKDQGIELEPEGRAHQASGDGMIQDSVSAPSNGQQKTEHHEEHQETFRVGRVPVSQPVIGHGVKRRAERCGNFAQGALAELIKKPGKDQQPEQVEDANTPERFPEKFRNAGEKKKDARRFRIPAVRVGDAAVQNAMADGEENAVVAVKGKADGRQRKEENEQERR